MRCVHVLTAPCVCPPLTPNEHFMCSSDVFWFENHADIYLMLLYTPPSSHRFLLTPLHPRVAFPISTLYMWPHSSEGRLASKPTPTHLITQIVFRCWSVLSPQAGFKAGYQKGVQVQVTVSLDLDDDSGSYLRRQQGSRQAGSSGTSTGPSSGSSSSSGGSSSQQPWLPQSRSTVSNTRVFFSARSSRPQSHSVWAKASRILHALHTCHHGWGTALLQERSV